MKLSIEDLYVQPSHTFREVSAALRRARPRWVLAFSIGKRVTIASSVLIGSAATSILGNSDEYSFWVYADYDASSRLAKATSQ